MVASARKGERLKVAQEAGKGYAGAKRWSGLRNVCRRPKRSRPGCSGCPVLEQVNAICEERARAAVVLALVGGGEW